MVKLTINGYSQSNSNINERWIQEQIGNRNRDKQPICIEIEINCGDINIILRNGGCPSSGNGGKPINRFSKGSQQIFALWEKAGFMEEQLNPGMLISFWKKYLKNCT